VRWAGNATHMGEMRNVHRILGGEPEGYRDHAEDLDVYGRIILKVS
jgi:hypothetical protein